MSLAINNMQPFQILITETLTRVIDVDAANEDEAINKVKEEYHNSDIILTSEDYSETVFSLHTN